MTSWLETSIYTLTFFALLVGLFGLLVPLFPGIAVMWLAVLGFAIVVGMDTLGWILFILITLLAIAGEVMDNVMMGAGARRGGASWKSIAAAFAAGVIFTFIFPPIGGLIAAPVAVLLVEYSRWGDWQKVWSAVRGLLAGWGISFVIRFLVGLVIIALWLVWAYFRA